MRKSLAALATVTLLSLASACGGPSGDDATPAAATASVETRPTAAASSSGLTRENFVDRLGTALTAAGSAHLEMESAAEGEPAMQGDVQLGDTVEDARTRVTLDLGSMPMEMRLVDGVAYLKLGQLTRGKYYKVDLTDPEDPIVQRFGSMADVADPGAHLQAFQSALVEFEDQGSGGRIDGVETTRIRLVLDTAKMTKGQGKAKGGMGGSVPKRIEYVLSVGPDDLMRRMTTELGGKPVTLDWSKWGEPVEVSAPPASKVTDLVGLPAFRGMGGSDHGA